MSLVQIRKSMDLPFILEKAAFQILPFYPVIQKHAYVSLRNDNAAVYGFM